MKQGDTKSPSEHVMAITTKSQFGKIEEILSYWLPRLKSAMAFIINLFWRE